MMGKGWKLCIGLAVVVIMSMSVLLGLGPARPHSVAYPNFVCATLVNSYGVCVGPPTTDR